MKIAIFGTGYVGLITGLGFADFSNSVTAYDVDLNIITTLNSGKSTIYEDRIDELLKKNLAEKRIEFKLFSETSLNNYDVYFLAVGTPSDESGAVDLTQIKKLAHMLGKIINHDLIVIIKSTVLVGTAEIVKNIILQEFNARNLTFNVFVISNPEFLREGQAVNDFFNPDRIVIGLDGLEFPLAANTKYIIKVYSIITELFQPFIFPENKVIFMDNKSAELTKYAANSFLAMKISFINQMALICEHAGADVNKIKIGIASDNRIGKSFLNPGIGYGGSCFPKDLSGLIEYAKLSNIDCELLTAVHSINYKIRKVYLNVILEYYQTNKLAKIIAIWGISFKPGTDDIRDAPAIYIIEKLIDAGYTINAHDPISLGKIKLVFKDKINYFEDKIACLSNCNGLFLITEWSDYLTPNFAEIANKLNHQVIFDGRNVYDPKILKQNGIKYISIGR